MNLLRTYIRGLLLEQASSTLYHGTTRPAAEKIMSQGFDKSLAGTKSDSALPGVSMTIDRVIAVEHATWAASKSKSVPMLLVMDASSLKLYPGDDFMELWDDLDSSMAAISEIQRSGEWDGVEMFSFEREEGLEEFEVLLFNYQLPVRMEEIE
jgi:hypothetical protein